MKKRIREERVNWTSICRLVVKRGNGKTSLSFSSRENIHLLYCAN